MSQNLAFDGRIPPALHPLLAAYCARLEQNLPGLVTACYLEGSLALGGFNPRLSDVDFIAVLSSPATPADAGKLAALHRDIEKAYPQWKLSGPYLQAGDLGRLDDGVQPFLNFHDGKLHPEQRLALSAISWWILKNRGIALFGPPPEQLPFQPDMEALLKGQLENMNSYWASYTTRLDGRLALLSDWGVEWTVLGVLRQLYTLRERSITTKTGAGQWALASLPERWRPIIREAIALRSEEKPRSSYRSRLTRAKEAYGLIKYVLATANLS